MEWRDVAWLAVGAVVATILLRRTRGALLSRVGRWPASTRIAASVAAGMLLGIGPRLVPDVIAPWVALVVFGMTLGAWSAMVLGSSGLTAWVHRIAFLAALVASAWLARPLSGL